MKITTTNKLKVTESELWDDNMDSPGACIACGEKCTGVEPDARKYECDNCGERQVYGLSELLIMDLLEISDDDICAES